MSPYIERVTLGKILLMQDLNIQFVRKSLNEVSSTDIVNDKSVEESTEISKDAAPEMAYE
jgi:hypothetical protein